MATARPEPEAAVNAMRLWLPKSTWAEDYLSFFEEFFTPMHAHGGRSYNEAKKMLPSRLVEIAERICLDEFLVFDADQSVRALSTFLSESQQRFTEEELDYLFNFGRTQASLYEVVAIHPGNEATLRDLLLEGEEVGFVRYESSTELKVGDGVFARIIGLDEIDVATGPFLLFSTDLVKSILESIETLVKETQQDLQDDLDSEAVPKVVALDHVMPLVPRIAINAWLLDMADDSELADSIAIGGGGALRLMQLSYPITADLETLKKALNRQKWLTAAPEVESWIWGSDNSTIPSVHGNLTIEGRRLIAFAMSEELGVRLQDRLEAVMGGMLGIPTVNKIMPSEVLREMHRDEQTRSEKEKQHAEAEEKAIHDFLDKQYHEMIDDNVLMLGKQKPRELVKTEEGRAKVAEWLRMLEQEGANSDVAQGGRKYDLSWMWDELGLQAYKPKEGSS